MFLLMVQGFRGPPLNIMIRLLIKTFLSVLPNSFNL